MRRRPFKCFHHRLHCSFLLAYFPNFSPMWTRTAAILSFSACGTGGSVFIRIPEWRRKPVPFWTPLPDKKITLKIAFFCFLCWFFFCLFLLRPHGQEWIDISMFRITIHQFRINSINISPIAAVNISLCINYDSMHFELFKVIIKSSNRWQKHYQTFTSWITPFFFQSRVNTSRVNSATIKFIRLVTIAVKIQPVIWTSFLVERIFPKWNCRALFTFDFFVRGWLNGTFDELSIWPDGPQNLIYGRFSWILFWAIIHLWCGCHALREPTSSTKAFKKKKKKKKTQKKLCTRLNCS